MALIDRLDLDLVLGHFADKYRDSTQKAFKFLGPPVYDNAAIARESELRATCCLRRDEVHRTLIEANQAEAFARTRTTKAARGWALKVASAALRRHRLAVRAWRDAEADLRRLTDPWDETG